MNKLNVNEKVQCVKWYFTGNSIVRVRDLFSAFFENRPIPSATTIRRIIEQFVETGSVLKRCKNCRKINAEDREDDQQNEINENKLNILLCVTENPSFSVRQIASELNLHPSTVHKILKKEKYNSYKYSTHQEIFEADKMARSVFCEIIMDKSNVDRDFLKFICFTDESTFTLHGEPNKQNYRIWSQRNPHLMVATHTQYPEKVNVWAGIFGRFIIGPFFIENNLNSEKYLDMLQNNIGPQIEEYASQDNVVWYQQDGCPAHYSGDIKLYLDQCFPNSWIGRGGPINWPARSPDLAPCDFFLWPYLKEKIYKRHIKNIVDLKNAIVDECNKITQTQLSSVRHEFYKRLGYCLAADGDLFEHLI